MANYVYIRSESSLWTVGFYRPDGKWEPESDHDTTDKAAARVNFLMGGKPIHLEAKAALVDELVTALDLLSDSVLAHITPETICYTCQGFARTAKAAIAKAEALGVKL